MVNGYEANDVGARCVHLSLGMLSVALIFFYGCVSVQSRNVIIAAASIIDEENALYVEIYSEPVTDSVSTYNIKDVGISYEASKSEPVLVERHCHMEQTDVQRYISYKAGTQTHGITIHSKCPPDKEKYEMYMPASDMKWKFLAACSDRLMKQNELIFFAGGHGWFACFEDWRHVDRPIASLEAELNKYRKSKKR